MSQVDQARARHARLSPAKQALLEHLKRGGSLPQAPPPAEIPRRPPQAPVPQSFAQQRLWFLDALVPGSPAYNIPTAVRLRGRLDRGALGRALDELVRRHEALRTTFGLEGEQPVQRVSAAGSVPLPLVALDGLEPGAREAESQRLAAEEARRPFDLAAGPLLRATLVVLSPEDHVLLLTLHHIVADGWSIGVLVREVSALYGAFVAGRPAPLAELSVQYGDYAAWQRGVLQGDALDAQVRYWRERLAGFPTSLDLVCDRPRPPVQTFRGASHAFRLPRRLAEELRGLCRACGVTPFMALLAAFELLLARLADQERFLVGTPVANRPRVELEGLIGFFANTLVLPADLSGAPSVRALLQRTRDTALGAFAHQDVPFELLVDELDALRDMSRNPLFQVMFVHQNAPIGELGLPGLELELVRGELETAKFDLWLSVAEGDEPFCTLQYNSDLFDARSIERLAEQYVHVLLGFVSAPDACIAAVPLMDAAGRETVVERFNRSAADHPAEALLHTLIEEQVRREPDAPALSFGSERLGYRELDERANGLARRLVALGVAPDMPVGVCLERSCDLVVALLAVLKAGGAYLPLDPEYPDERLAFMLADAGTPLVLAHERFRERLEALGARVELPAAESCAQPPPVAVAPDQLAYVIYTSGSTGRPKGAMLSHRGICNRLLWMQAQYALTARDVVLQKTPFSFDVSVWEFFWPLLAGCRLVLAEPGGHRDPAYLLALIESEGVTTLHFVPSMLQVFLETLEPGRCPSVRLVFCSGEALPFAFQERFFAKSAAELHNLYGPTEASVDVTHWACERVPRAPVVPIGRPVANTQAYVLDRRLEPCALGVPGRLYLGGVQLARGYLRRPALTAERFVPDPLGRTPGARLYDTGDVARWRPDGSLEYLGRADQQVKLRGFRIELGEVESALRRHAAVSDAAVLVHEQPDTHPRLVAYVVAARGDRPSSEAERVGEWQAVFERAYERPAGDEAHFNVASWDSSYTGAAIPAEHMAEWVEASVASILALEPKRLLEIGCGTGLLAFRLAPGCARYVGTDVAEAALAHVRRHWPGTAPELLRREARDLSGLEAGSFDTVVLNSVAQYFPDARYLAEVLERAMELVADGGSVFVGDVRCLGLAEAFHAGVELSRAQAGWPTARLLERVRTRAGQERELLVAPEFFEQLAERLPRVGGLELQLRRGRCDNEMNRYRYDVVLRVGAAAMRPAVADRREWGAGGLGLESLERLLAGEHPAALELLGIPNARIASDVRCLQRLESGEPGTVGDLLSALEADAPRGVQPDDLRDLGRRHGYRVALRFSTRSGALDATLWDPSRAGGPLERPRAGASGAPLTNDPLAARRAHELVPVLRAHLKAALPEFMVPSAFVLMEALPLLTNGKLDRAALPPPVALESAAAHVEPRTPAERCLAEIWARALGVERVSVTANYFELGGDSIGSIQIVARARQAGLLITARQMFEHPTVAELAAVAATADESASAGVPWPLTPEQAAALLSTSAMCLLIDVPPAGADVKESLSGLARHDALRWAVSRAEDGKVRSLRVETGAPELEHHDLRTVGLEEQARRIRQLARDLAHGLRTEGGRLARLACFDLGARRLLALAAHPVAADAALLAQLGEELARRLAGGAPLADPPAVGERTVAGAQERVSLELPAGLSASVLGPANRAYGTQADDLLLAAAALAAASRGDAPSPQPDLGALVKDLKEGLRKAARPAWTGDVPAAWAGGLRYLGSARYPQAGPGWRLLERDGPETGLAVRLARRGESLAVDWFAPRGQAQALAAAFEQQLARLVAHCLAAPRAYTPSDFPLAGLDQPALDELLAGREGVEDLYPLAPLQEFMAYWHEAQHVPGLYVVHMVTPLRGLALDVEAFERAWREIVARHAALRTSFLLRDGQRPLQAVWAGVVVPVEQRDLRGLQGDEQQALVKAHVALIRARGFELGRAPHMELTLFRTDEDAYEFCWVFNYMLQEGWSYPLILKDFFALYDALAAGREATLAPVRPYREHLAWLARQDLSAARGYWTRLLAGFTGRTPLVERLKDNRPEPGEDYVKHKLVVPLATTAALRALARRRQVTLYALAQAAWAIVLWAETGESDVLYGSVSSGRPAELEGVEAMVGSFNNLLPARARLRAEQRLDDWLIELQAEQLEQRQHEQTRLLELLDWRGLPRAERLFDSYLVFENYPFDESVLSHGRSWDIQVGSAITQTEHPLRIQIWPLPGAPLLVLTSYYPAVVGHAAVARLMESYRATLERIAQEPGRRLGELVAAAVPR